MPILRPVRAGIEGPFMSSRELDELESVSLSVADSSDVSVIYEDPARDRLPWVDSNNGSKGCIETEETGSANNDCEPGTQADTSLRSVAKMRHTQISTRLPDRFGCPRRSNVEGTYHSVLNPSNYLANEALYFIVLPNRLTVPPVTRNRPAQSRSKINLCWV